jgi:UDP-N-acetylmuramoylalanine--D-glutamate ligase
MASRDYFKGKRIGIIGLGCHGELVPDVKFLIKAGALVSVYDMKSEVRIKHHLTDLRSIGLANYTCGSIPEEDLLDLDIIVLSHEYPRDSSFLKGVYEQNARIGQTQTEDTGSIHEERQKIIAVEYPETLFFKRAPPITLVGIIGMAGKSTVMSILGPMLEKVCKQQGSQGMYTIDPESSEGILAHLKKIKSGDIVVMRIVDLIQPELHALRISPHVAIFTSVPPRTSYIDAPFEILDFQTYNNFIVASDAIIDHMRDMKIISKAKLLRTKSSLVPHAWGFQGSGIHDRMNAALALQAARLFTVEDDVAHGVLSRWKPLRGRLELVKKVRGIDFFNDSLASNPSSTLAGIIALSQSRNLILIFGGSDLGHVYRELFTDLPRYVHTLITIPGSGTLRQRPALNAIEGLTVLSAPSLDEAVHLAAEHAQKGDRVLFSPGFDSGGTEGSKVERGERFVKAVRGL